MSGQLQWLVDRAHISDLLGEFARALEAGGWDGEAAAYVEDAEFHVGTRGLHGGNASRRGRQNVGTWHGSSDHAILIDGDVATSRSYLRGVHLLGGGTFHHADGSGWYDCTLRRTGGTELAGGWRIVTVQIAEETTEEVWHSGEPLHHLAWPVEAS